MPLAEGQVQIRDLVIGPGTAFRFVKGQHFNPFSRSVRADQGGARAWADGSWSGAEWAEQIALPMRLVILASGAADYAARMHELLAAFAPASADLDLLFTLGGVEYLMRGRPRMVDPESRHVDGHTYVQAAWVCLDPAIYSATEHQAQTGLPSSTGGLTLPVTAPCTVDALTTSGRRTITNAGTRTTGLLLRVDGPVPEPRISLITDTGATTLRLFLTLEAGQWLDIDTAARTVYLNGTVSRRGQASGGWPTLPSGSSEVSFAAGMHDPDALLTVAWRDTWH
jgi:hypothetical protein